MTQDQCRAVEALHFNGGQCNWPEGQIVAAIEKWRTICNRLIRGEEIDISEDMGECRCGDISASVSLKNNIPWCESTGRMKWQRYSGPAAACHVSYGVGVRARQIAAAWAAIFDA